jgi:thioredoxin 1
MKAVCDAPIRAGAAVLDRVLASGVPALIVFETPNCEPCQALRPVLEDLAGEFRSRVVVLCVTDAGEGWLAARYHLSFVPTLLFCRGGREVARIKGNAVAAAVREHVEFLLSGDIPPEPAEGPRHTLAARFGGNRLDKRAEPLALLFAGH